MPVGSCRWAALGLLWAATLQHWASATTDDDRDIPILVLLPGQAPNKYIFPFGLEMCGPAVFTAIEEIQRKGILPGHRLVADVRNSGCNAIKGIGLAYENLHQRNYTAIIGPACSEVCKMVARLATFLNIPCFSSVCQDIEMNDKSHFKTLTRFQGTFEMTGYAVGSILQYFGWNRVGILAERKVDIIWLHTRRGLQYAFERMNITIAMSTLMDGDTGLEKYLVETAKVARVIILPMLGKTLRKALLLAHKHGLNKGDYIFISVTYYDQRSKFGYYGWDYGDENDTIVKEMFQSLFFISYYVRSENDDLRNFRTHVKDGAAKHYNYIYGPNQEVPYPAANLYEALHVFAIALNETLEEGGDIRDGQLVARRLWGRSFPSLTGGLTLNDKGDREQAYMIKHIQDGDTTEIPVIANFFSGNKSLTLLIDRIIWAGGRTSPPPDTPPCGFEGELCIEDPYAQMIRIVAIFSGVLVFTFIVATILVLFVYRRMKWEKAIADRKWKINHEDVIEDKGTAYSQSILSTISMKTTDTTGTIAQRFAQTGLYKGIRVAIKTITHIKEVDMSNREFLYEMKMLHDLAHPNLVKFVGASIAIPKIRIYTEYCMKGGLQDVLENAEIQLDWAFKCSLMLDILGGLQFIQESFLKYHGNLRSSACLVDGRFVVKLTNFGIRHWRKDPDRPTKDFLWTSPETLVSGADAGPKGDVYSFGIILQEIVMREGPFYTDDLDTSAEDKVANVMRCSRPPYRPSTIVNDCPVGIIQLMTRCWAEDPLERPTVPEIKASIKEASGLKGKNLNIMDNLLQRMEQYANNLEGLVEERTGKYLEEKKRAEDLLHRLLPASIADELQLRGVVDPVSYESVTIYFSDIVSFTPICSSSTPIQVVNLLNDLYTLFDSTIARYDVYKVETIGDAYMTVSGLPKTNGNRHVREIGLMALALLDAVKTFKIRHKPDTSLLLRIGLHTGSCVAGVVGLTMPRYCLFGDTVNTASRMESNGEALKIHISPETKTALDEHPGFQITSRGEMFIKGKGNMETFWLVEGPEQRRKKGDRHIQQQLNSINHATDHPFGSEA